MKKIFNIIITMTLLFSLFVLFSCQNDNDDNQSSTKTKVTKNNSEKDTSKKTTETQDISKTPEEKEQRTDSDDEGGKEEDSPVNLVLKRKNLIEEFDLEVESDLDEPITLKIAVPNGSPAVTFARAIEEKGFTKNIKADIKLLDGPSQIPSILIKGDYPFVFMPLNLASKMYNKGINYKLLNVVVWGSFNIVTSNQEIKNLEDLKNKDLYLFGEGSTPDILTRFFLEGKGIDPDKDINLIYQQANQNAQLLIAGKIETALVPEPVSTKAQMENNKLRTIIEYNEEWKKSAGKDKPLAQAGIMVNSDYAQNNPDVVKSFEEIYRKEITMFYDKPDLFGKLSAKNKIVSNEEIVTNSYKNLGVKYKSAVSVMDEVKAYLNVLYKFDPKVIGGKIPGDDFFYKK